MLRQIVKISMVVACIGMISACKTQYDSQYQNPENFELFSNDSDSNYSNYYSHYPSSYRYDRNYSRQNIMPRKHITPTAPNSYHFE